jgi:hypothetical protein
VACTFVVIPAKKAVKEWSRAPDIAHLVVPAEAGISGFQSLALGPAVEVVRK